MDSPVTLFRYPGTHPMANEFLHSLRGVRRNPGFALLSIVTLALGIGISTAVFTVVNGVLLQPLQFPQADRIVRVNTRTTDYPNGSKMTGGDFVDVRAANKVFDAISVYNGGEIGVQLRGRAEFTGIFWVNPDFFSVFGQSPATFTDSTAVVSEAFAVRNFGDSQRALGQSIHVENRVYEISSVLKGPRFPANAEIWLRQSDPPENPNRTSYNYRAVALLKPGVSLAQAQANLDSIAAQLASAFPKSNHGKTFAPVPLRDQLTGSIQSTLYLLLGAVLLVLLIACANVSNLLLARATIRAREIAVRAALGASRVAIVKMLVIESLTLSLLGGLLGIALAYWGTQALLHFAPSDLPRADEIHLDYAVLAFATSLSLVSAMVFGVLPALQASRAEFSSRGVLRGGSHRLRNSLIVAEIALSFILATGAGLFFRSFLALNSVDMGFRQDNVLVMYAHAPAKELSQYVAVTHSFVDQLLPSLAAMPGVQATAAVMGLPTGQYGSNGSYAVVGKQSMKDSGKLPESNWALTSPNYFAAMHIPLLSGRDFTPQDQYTSPGIVIISESVARQNFSGEDPLGRQLQCGLDDVTMKAMTIVGVAGDVRQDSPGRPPQPTLYMPMEQHPYHSNELQVIVRTAASPTAMTPTVRKAAHDLNPEMAVKFTTLEEMVSGSISAPRFRTFLAGSFAVLALLLAMAGIYGVMSYVVTQRTPELGLRMALGAARADVIGLVLSRATLLAAIGLAIGAVLSLALSRFVTAMLYGLTSTDPSTYAVVLLWVAAIAILAATGPAWRASRIDPMVALRQE
jgi:putative ABC transport system permease protein